MTSNLDYVYNTIISTEVFEHLEYIKILEKLAKGTKIIFSVPNFIIDSHLYNWQNAKEIRRDFSKYIDIKTIEKPLQIKDKIWFLISGIVK